MSFVVISYFFFSYPSMLSALVLFGVTKRLLSIPDITEQDGSTSFTQIYIFRLTNQPDECAFGLWEEASIHRGVFHTGTVQVVEQVPLWILRTLVLSSKPAHVHTSSSGSRRGFTLTSCLFYQHRIQHTHCKTHSLKLEATFFGSSREQTFQVSKPFFLV